MAGNFYPQPPSPLLLANFPLQETVPWKENHGCLIPWHSYSSWCCCGIWISHTNHDFVFTLICWFFHQIRLPYTSHQQALSQPQLSIDSASRDFHGWWQKMDVTHVGVTRMNMTVDGQVTSVDPQNMHLAEHYSWLVVSRCCCSCCGVFPPCLPKQTHFKHLLDLVFPSPAVLAGNYCTSFHCGVYEDSFEVQFTSHFFLPKEEDLILGS